MTTHVVCMDGTANGPGSVPTNVLRFYRRLVQDDAQRALYEPGVGTFSPLSSGRGTRAGRTLGSLFGHGLTENLENGYRFLMRRRQPGDAVALFGFSRGAFAVRALSGLIQRCGLLRPELDGMVTEALRVYQLGDDADARAEQDAFREAFARPCPIDVIGVWDTVKSLGTVYSARRFFDAALVPCVRAGYHALAIDERRPKFEPLPWEPDQRVRQVWFPGAHADVGGGYEDRALAEGALQWMMDRAAAHGVRFVDDPDVPQPANPLGRRHDSAASWSGRALRATHLGSRPRTVPAGAWVHESAVLRRAGPLDPAVAGEAAYDPDLPEDVCVVGAGGTPRILP